MKLKQLFTDEDAVSPVIGVILMVAITVILAAVIGTFVLGLGESVQTTPQASFSYDYDETGTTLTITHVGGDTIEKDKLDITASGGGDGVDTVTYSTTEISAGDTITVTDVESGATVRIVYKAEGGDTAVLSTFTGPDA